jgi:hypothetical protein
MAALADPLFVTDGGVPAGTVVVAPIEIVAA